MLRRLSIVALVVLTVGCGVAPGGVTEDGGSRGDGGEHGAADGGGAVVLCAAVDAGVLPDDACHKTVRMTSLSLSSEGCFVDAARLGDTAELWWDCSQRWGRAELRYATLTARGAWNEPGISVCFGTHFAWTDGCAWQSAQVVEGTPTTGSTLSFTYTELPDPGQRNCVTPCSATGTFVVE